MNQDNDALPDDPFSDEEDLRSIDDLIREDQEAEQEEDEILENERKQGRTKKIVFGVLGLIAVCGITVSAVVFNPFDNDQKVGTGETISQPSDNGGDDQDTSDDNNADLAEEVDDFYLEEGKYFPTEVDEWAKTQYSEEKVAESSEAIINTAKSEEIGQTAMLLPSEEVGYTSNEDQKILDDGTFNPFYSYWTMETFDKEARTAIERLINPTFGGWGVYQYPAYNANTEYDQRILNDLFTTNFLKKNEGKPYSEYMPIYADWNSDNYGGQNNLLEAGPRWHGDIKDSTTEFVYDDSSNQYVVNYTADVKFTAWGQDQSILEKNGVLTIKFVANANGEGVSSHKVLIDEADLKVE